MAAYQLHTITASITQWVIFAEAVAKGQAVFELEPEGPAAQEIEIVKAEVLEYAK